MALKIYINTDAIAERMADIGLSQHALVHSAGVNQRTFTKMLEDGYAAPRIAGKLARALGMSVEEIRDGEAGK